MPVLACRDDAVLISQPVRGGQFSDTPEHGSWFRNEAMPKVRNDRFCVRISQLRYRCENGLDLRRKYQPTSLLSIEEGFRLLLPFDAEQVQTIRAKFLLLAGPGE